MNLTKTHDTHYLVGLFYDAGDLQVCTKACFRGITHLKHKIKAESYHHQVSYACYKQWKFKSSNKRSYGETEQWTWHWCRPHRRLFSVKGRSMLIFGGILQQHGHAYCVSLCQNLVVFDSWFSKWGSVQKETGLWPLIECTCKQLKVSVMQDDGFCIAPEWRFSFHVLDPGSSQSLPNFLTFVCAATADYFVCNTQNKHTLTAAAQQR